jgi:hypothetical protein
MPPYVGGLLILRGLRGSKTAVEEVHGCALRSAEGDSVLEYVNHLLLNYEDSVRADETIALFVFPDRENFVEALVETFTKIWNFFPEDPASLQDCGASNFLAIRGLLPGFLSA